MSGWDGEKQTFSEWCTHHRGVFAFIRSVCAVIGVTVFTVILARGCL